MSEILRKLASRNSGRFPQLMRRPTTETVVHREKPIHFDVPYLVGRPVAYRLADGNLRETGDGGVLAVGEVVWLRRKLRAQERGSDVLAWAQVTGMVLADPRELVPLRHHE